MVEETEATEAGSEVTVLSKISEELRDEVAVVKQLVSVAAERLTAVESRLGPVEVAVSKIPSLEAHLSRVDAMLLTMQGDIRRMEKSSNAHSLVIEKKLDEVLAALRK